MKRFIKKMSAVVIAACMSAVIAVPFSGVPVSADTTTWICGDVNNDDSISSLDLVHLNKYLAGMIELVNYGASDVTGNYVINAIDAKILSNYLVGKINYLPYSVTTE